MNGFNSSEAMKIAIEHGCKTVKEFAEFIKLYNKGLVVVND